MLKRLALSLVVAGAAFAALGSGGCRELSSSLTQGLAPSTSIQIKAPSLIPTRTPQQPSPAPAPSAWPTETPKPDKLVLVDEVVGKGSFAKPYAKVTVNYTMWLADAPSGGSPVDTKKAFAFTLLSGQVIPGLDQGVIGMAVGGKRKLTIPPSLGYGAQGGLGGAVPPDAKLVVEVQLLKAN